MKHTFIIILHIGDLEITKNCIESLIKHEKDFTEIIVVNNDTIILSKKDLPFPKLSIINNKKNLGFAKGVNVGISYALKKKADVLLLLNNDTYIKKPFIGNLLVSLGRNPTIGIIGPAISFGKDGKKVFDLGGSIDMVSGKTYHKEVERITNESIHTVDYVSGAAMLIKKEVFEKVGMFDEQFFLYYEDADFCLRAKAKGFSTRVNPNVIVYHLLSKTIGKTTPFAVYYQTKSLLIFGKKYMKSPAQKIRHIFFMLSQTTKITIKHPRVGLAGWKAVLQLISHDYFSSNTY